MVNGWGWWFSGCNWRLCVSFIQSWLWYPFHNAKIQHFGLKSSETGGICLQKRHRQEVSVNCKSLVIRWLAWLIVCKNRGCSSVVLRSWGHEVMRSWRSWRWMQSANGYTFPKEIIIYNIYNILYIIIYLLYLRIRFKSRQNAYNLKPPSPLLRSSWPSWPHDLMTSWPHDLITTLQNRWFAASRHLQLQLLRTDKPRGW